MASLGSPAACTLVVVSWYQVIASFRWPRMASRFKGGNSCATDIDATPIIIASATMKIRAGLLPELMAVFIRLVPYCLSFVDKTLAASRKVCPELTEGDLQCGDERSRASLPFSQAEPTGSILQSRFGPLNWPRDWSCLYAAIASARAHERACLLDPGKSSSGRWQAISGGSAGQYTMGAQCRS